MDAYPYMSRRGGKPAPVIALARFEKLFFFGHKRHANFRVLGFMLRIQFEHI